TSGSMAEIPWTNLWTHSPGASWARMRTGPVIWAPARVIRPRLGALAPLARRSRHKKPPADFSRGLAAWWTTIPLGGASERQGHRAVAPIQRTRTTRRQPDGAEVLVHVVAGRDLPAVHAGGVRHDALPPHYGHHVRLLVQHALLVLPHELLARLGVLLAALPVEQGGGGRGVVAAVVAGAAVGRHELHELQVRLVHEVAVEVDARLEIAAAQVVREGPGLLQQVVHVQADAPPLVDQEHAHGLVRHRHVAVLEG